MQKPLLNRDMRTFLIVKRLIFPLVLCYWQVNEWGSRELCISASALVIINSSALLLALAVFVNGRECFDGPDWA